MPLELDNNAAAEMEALEWEQLRVEGKPLLSGAAFGATPLLWVACRAQPCLVHIFCDTQLQNIWRFPADPVFLLIGSGKDRAQCNGRLLVITRDGCIWIVPLSKTRASASRPAKKRKTQKVGEIQRVQPKTTIAEALSGASQTVQSSCRWKELTVETYAPRALEVKNVVVADTLLGTVPGATLAAFGPNNHVALGSPVGSPELLNVNKLIASHPAGSEFRTSTPVLRRGTTCLLVVSSVQHRQTHGDSQAHFLSHDLFESLSSPSASDPEILLLTGGMDGKVRTFHMQKGTLITPPHVVYDLQQPVVTIIPVAYPLAKTGTQECDGANWLVVMGLLGQVVFLSSVTDRSTTLEEPNDSPFLPHTPLRVENKCTLKKKKKIVSNEGGVINGPIASACLVGGARLCYTVGSVVFITELFENVSTGVENSRSTENAPMKLPSQRISVSNVAAITGPGLFPYHGTHSLVVLTGAGRLFSIKASKQMASAGNLGVDCCQDSYSGRSVKVSLQSIADAGSCRDAIQSHEQALTLAMNELALALPRARNLATDKKGLAFKTGPKGDMPTAHAGLGCTLTATPVPSTSLRGDQLSFGGFRKPPNFVDRNVYKSFKTRLDIALINQGRTPLSQYWSLILELQSCLSTASPTSQCSFTINNGHGVPIGFQWNHRIHVNLPGGPWGPVMATLYLCHIHDSHKALLQNSRSSGLGRASSAACVVLLRQQIDIFSLLQGPQSTLGHTSWTPAFSGNNNLKRTTMSFTGMEEIEMLDLADSDTLGSFSGDLTWSFSLDVKQNVSRTVNGAADWQNGFFRSLLQQPSTSTEWKRLRLTSQGGGTVAMSIDGRGQGGEFQSVVKIQTPCLLLGILLRQALLWQLDAEAALLGKKELLVFLQQRQQQQHRNQSVTSFVTRLNEVQALAQRAREALHLWHKFQTPNAPPAQDLVAPLLGHTYVVTAELIQAYKNYREAS